MRLPFLILTPACLLLGIGTALRNSGRLSPLHIALTLVGAISAHVSVNVFNEYFDFKSGLDSRTERTPFSGGSGTLPGRPDMADATLYVAMISLGITIMIGAYFSMASGLALLPLGGLGIMVIILYTPWVTRHPALCLIAPGLGFGPLMVMGTNFVLTGHYSWESFTASLIPFFLVNNLLLLNQFPDVEADKSIGRKHLPIIIGRRNSSLIYTLFLASAYITILAGVYLGYFPSASLLGMATLILAVPVSMAAFRYADDTKRLIPYMGLNVIINIATPVLVAIGLVIG